MAISVIMPAYNSEKWIAESIESVRGQTYTTWELVVVDDGSVDSTASIVARYSNLDRRIRYLRQETKGVAGARNRGISEANHSSEFIAFLDHDDVWRDFFLDSLLPLFASDAAAVAAYGLARLIDGQSHLIDADSGSSQKVRCLIDSVDAEGRVVHRGVPPDQPPTFEMFITNYLLYTPGQALIKRSALDSVGYFDPMTVPADDWDLFIRL
jgi:glycosyltransferase involved in cell wall biosynthesis